MTARQETGFTVDPATRRASHDVRAALPGLAKASRHMKRPDDLLRESKRTGSWRAAAFWLADSLNELDKHVRAGVTARSERAGLMAELTWSVRADHREADQILLPDGTKVCWHLSSTPGRTRWVVEDRGERCVYSRICPDCLGFKSAQSRRCASCLARAKKMRGELQAAAHIIRPPADSHPLPDNRFRTRGSEGHVVEQPKRPVMVKHPDGTWWPE